MYTTTSTTSHENAFEIKQDDKFFSRLLSKETSVSTPSFRVYYNGSVSVAVPFTWESQPGTPKHTFYEHSLPPLTPPPSHYSSHPKNNSLTTKKTSFSGSTSNNSILQFLFSRLSLKKSLSLSSSWPSSDYSSGNVDVALSNVQSGKRHCELDQRSGSSSGGSSFDSRSVVCDEDAPPIGSPTSTLCFGISKVGKKCKSR